MTLRTISYGGGVQSTAMVVLAATRDPDFEAAMGGPVDAALFANVGDDSEHPATLAYVRDVAIPWAHGRGFAVHELPLPIRGVNGAPGTRSCTADFKVQVVAKWLKQHGATKDAPATVAIGISTDEVQRIGNKKNAAHERAVYPLIELGLDRQGCMNVTASAGLPVPGKSSCFFCPFHRPQVWAEMRRDEPDLFQKSVEIERYIIDQQTRRDRLPLYLTRFGKPLDEAISEAQDQLPGFESIGESGCDEGYCFT